MVVAGQVESSPVVIKEGLSKAEAEDLQKKIEAGGYTESVFQT